MSEAIKRHAPNALKGFKDIYNDTIDLGAHPNVLGTLVMTAIAPLDAKHTDATILAAADKASVVLGLTFVTKAGLIAIDCGDSILGSRFLGGASFGPAIERAKRQVLKALEGIEGRP